MARKVRRPSPVNLRGLSKKVGASSSKPRRVAKRGVNAYKLGGKRLGGRSKA